MGFFMCKFHSIEYEFLGGLRRLYCGGDPECVTEMQKCVTGMQSCCNPFAEERFVRWRNLSQGEFGSVAGSIAMFVSFRQRQVNDESCLVWGRSLYQAGAMANGLHYR